MYSKVGRASVPPERLLKASLLISLYSVRSERGLLRGVGIQSAVSLVFGHEPDGAQLRPHGVHQEPETTCWNTVTGQVLFDEVVWEADRRGLLSDEHFSVDGTLIEAVASIKSFRRRDEEEPPPERRPRQSVGGLSWGEVEERDPREQDGPRGEVDAEG